MNDKYKETLNAVMALKEKRNVAEERSEKDAIIFAPHTIMSRKGSFGGKEEIVLYGRTIYGTSACLVLKDVYNTFCVRYNESWERGVVIEFVKKLEKRVISEIKEQSLSKKDYRLERLLKIVGMMGCAFVRTKMEEGCYYQYYTEKPIKVVKIYVVDTAIIGYCEEVIKEMIKEDEGSVIEILSHRVKLTERLCAEYRIYCEKWYHVVRGEDIKRNTFSNCTIEWDVSVSSFKAFEIQKLGVNANAQARKTLLAYDIECSSVSGDFVTPENDPCIMIGVIISNTGEAFTWDGDMLKRRENLELELGLCYGTCESHLEKHQKTHVMSFVTEKEMLEFFFQIVSLSETDIICGYNSNDFDNNYVVKRAEHLGVKKINFSKNKFKQVKIRLEVRSQKCFGAKEFKVMEMDGIFSLDLMIYESIKSRTGRYISLGYLASKVLGTTKEEMDHHLIPEYYKTESGRTKLLSYCMQDVVITLRIIQKKKVITNLIEESRIKGVPINELLETGISKHVGRVIENIMVAQGVYDNYKGVDLKGLKYNGGLCLQPKIGLHYDKKQIIVTEDFNSLYPSIMIGANMGTDTLIKGEYLLKNFPSWKRGTDYKQIGAVTINSEGELCIEYNILNDQIFVTPKHRVSIFTSFLKNFLNERSLVRAEMERLDIRMNTEGKGMSLEEKKEIELSIATLQSKQLQYKLAANGTYGFLGAEYSEKANKFVASAITREGRNMITLVQFVARLIYTPNGCYPFSYLIKKVPKIIYGDTDSVFVKLYFVREVENMMGIAFIIGTHLSVMISSLFAPPNCLALEKNLSSLMLFAKKKYSSVKCLLNPSQSITDMIKQSIIRYNSMKIGDGSFLTDFREEIMSKYPEMRVVRKLNPKTCPFLEATIFQGLSSEKITINTNTFIKYHPKVCADFQTSFGEEHLEEYETLVNSGEINYKTVIPNDSKEFDTTNIFHWDDEILCMVLPLIKYSKNTDHKGIELAQSGGSEFINDLQSSILTTLLQVDVDMTKEERKKKIENTIIKELVALKRGEISIQKLVASKKISRKIKSVDMINSNNGGVNSSRIKYYKNEQQPHLQCAISNYKKDSMKKPEIGSLVHYVMVKGNESGNFGNPKMSKCAKDPTYVFENNLPLNLEYYTERVRKMLVRTIAPLYTNNVLLFIGKYEDSLVAERLRKENRIRQKDLDNSVNFLFNSPELKFSVKRYGGALHKFVVHTCELCGKNQVYKDSIVCLVCHIERKNEVCSVEKERKMKLLASINKQYELQKKCNVCQKLPGDNKENIVCVNVTCNIFWPRKYLEKEINKLEKRVVLADVEDVEDIYVDVRKDVLVEKKTNNSQIVLSKKRKQMSLHNYFKKNNK